MSNRNAHVLVGGDFNCRDIELSHMQVPHGVQKRQSQQQLLDIMGEHCLTQVVNIPTRNSLFHTEFSRHDPISSELSLLEKYLTNQKNFPTT